MLQYESGIQQLFFFFTTMHALLKASNPYSRLNFISFSSPAEYQQQSTRTRVQFFKSKKAERSRTDKRRTGKKQDFLCSSAKIESM